MFNNSFIYKDDLASYIEANIIIYDLLGNLSHQYLFIADIKYRY